MLLGPLPHARRGLLLVMVLGQTDGADEAIEPEPVQVKRLFQMMDRVIIDGGGRWCERCRRRSTRRSQ
jgi:hypothetical protein